MTDEPKHIAQVLAEIALEHATRAYAFAPNSYTHEAMLAVRDAARVKPETELKPHQLKELKTRDTRTRNKERN